MTIHRQFFVLALTLAFVFPQHGQAQSGKALHYKQIKYPPLRELQIPEPARVELKNGMVLYLLEDHTLPLIQASLLVKTGFRYEPADKIGLASITGQVMRTGGTTTKTGDELDEMLEKVGASVETFIGSTSGGARLSVLREDIDLGLGVLADLFENPAFRDDKIELAKIAARSSISRRNDQVGAIAGREFTRLIYGPNHPYARITQYATIENISKQDLIDFHKKYFVPNNMYLAMWGDFRMEEMKEKLEKAFGSWERKEATLPPVPQPRLASQSTLNFIKKDDVNQSQVFAGHLGGLLNDPDSGPLNVADQAFGGSSASRLFKHIRSEQGLAYSVGSSWGENFDYQGIFQLGGSTKSETTVKMIRSLQKELADVVNNGITDAELKYAKESYLNSFVFQYDTKGKVINQLMTLEFYGYPKDFIQKQQQDIRKSTKASVHDAIKKRWKSDALAWLVVGKESDFDEPLKNVNPNVRTIDITIPEPPEKIPDATPETIAKGKDILRKTLAAMGGKALLNIKDIVLTATMIVQTPQGEMEMSAEMTRLKPNRIAQKMITPFGEIMTAYDGKSGWMKSPMGVQDIPPQQRDQLQQELIGNVNNVLENFEGPDYAVQYLKEEKVDGKAKHVVLVKHSPSNYSMRLVVDGETMLLAKKISRRSGMGGLAEIEEQFSDYRLINGVQVPFKILGFSDGKKQSEITFTSVKIDTGVKEDLFKRP